MTSNRGGEGRAVWLSAVSGEGIPMLLDAICDRLGRKSVHRIIHLKPSQGRQRAKLFELGAVTHEETDEDGSWILELKMSERDLKRFMKREKLAPELLEPPSVVSTATAATIK